MAELDCLLLEPVELVPPAALVEPEADEDAVEPPAEVVAPEDEPVDEEELDEGGLEEPPVEVAEQAATVGSVVMPLVAQSCSAN